MTPTKSIILHHVYPPIPDRRWDWMATWSDYDPDPECRHPVGRGPTEAAAIADLWGQEAPPHPQEPPS